MQQQLHHENSQILVCLHGGAGTGKSYVLKGIYQGLNKLLNQKPGQQTNNLTTLLIAPTGKAAHNIKGHTIHSAFHIPANQSLYNYTKLSLDNLNTYHSKYHNLKWIICDEISMVSNNMLRYIHLCMQEIKSKNLPFGGINMIAVGDFYQLKPVMGQFIFENYNKNYGPSATNLWTHYFKLYELTEIMWQKDDKKFAQLLNRLRIGNHTRNDIKISKRKINHTGGLPNNVTLIANQQYDLISNIDVNDGLINGTQCIIKYIQTTNHNDTTLPFIVWVDFQNPDIGANHHQKYTFLFSRQKTNRQWTPIIKIKCTFIVKDPWIHRIQFPLRQAAARTIHVAQSSTYPEIYVDLQTNSKPPTTFWKHMHYVAFSRVTSISGLYIENINEDNIAISQKVSHCLTDALQNNALETNIAFKNNE